MRAGARAEGPADAELLDRMRDGDESALEVLYARYGGLVYTLALRIVGDPASLEDIRSIVVTEEPAQGSVAPTGTHLLEATAW